MRVLLLVLHFSLLANIAAAPLGVRRSEQYGRSRQKLNLGRRGERTEQSPSVTGGSSSQKRTIFSRKEEHSKPLHIRGLRSRQLRGRSRHRSDAKHAAEEVVEETVQSVSLFNNIIASSCSEVAAAASNQLQRASRSCSRLLRPPAAHAAASDATFDSADGPRSRGLRFWSMSTLIYLSYKRMELQSKLNVRRLSPDEQEEAWDALHELNSDRMLDMCLQLRGFYLKASSCFDSVLLPLCTCIAVCQALAVESAILSQCSVLNITLYLIDSVLHALVSLTHGMQIGQFLATRAG
jgi:hypothetical protein